MVAVIMAGGSGTRFWPLSRASYPKQFLRIIGGTPLLRVTYERLRPLFPDERILVVVGREHEAETRRILSDTRVTVLVEPFGRNTAPCVGLAARYAAWKGIQDPLVILPADHYIADAEAFRTALQKAGALCAEGGIGTLGIVPTRPETGYGYIEADQDSHSGHGAYAVARFVEKPPLETAAAYFQSGRHYWNAGVFLATPETLLREFARYMPDFAERLKALDAAFHTPRFDEVLESIYRAVENISFDYAIMEKTTERVFVVPVDCGWSDVGSWLSLYEVRRRAHGISNGTIVEGDAEAIGCRECFVVAEGGRFVAALGLERVLVVDTSDALLVAHLDSSQEVRTIVDHLKRHGREELL